MARLDLNDSYHMLFWEEAREQIGTMEKELLLVEAGLSSDETINRIFRMAHSIKGASATLELKDLMALSHGVESVLTLVRQRQISLDVRVMGGLLEAIDGIKAVHEGLLKEAAPEVDVPSIIIGLEALLTHEPPANRQRKCLSVLFEPDTELIGLKAFMVVNAISDCCRVISADPPDYETLEDEDFGDRLTLCLETEVDDKEILERLEDLTELRRVTLTDERVLPCVESPEPVRSENLTKPVTSHGSSEKTTVKVNIQKIDQLINLVGELIIDKESLHSVAKGLRASYRKDKHVIRLLEVCEHLHYLGSELQEIALSTRMLPLENLFDKFPRMVRDLALQCSKQIHFSMEGKEHGIDRSMIEDLMDPLTHLLRNAIDHGIEDEWQRLERGKPAQGSLKLTASQGENHILITVEDDGGGIDLSKIQKKALEKGWITLEEAPYLSDEDWMRYIFEPGFTTASEVSDISGRGVGLDVVKSNISRLSGQIDVQSELCTGTRFIIKLPLTLAIIKAMLVREDACTFAVPVSAIVEVFRLKEAEITERIHSTGYSQVLHWRDFTIPLISLSQFFELKSPKPDKDKLYVMVLGIGEKRTAVVVESILGEQEIVIKSMGEFVGKDKLFGELEGISGVSILGDGGLAHILDVGAIIRN